MGVPGYPADGCPKTSFRTRVPISAPRPPPPVPVPGLHSPVVSSPMVVQSIGAGNMRTITMRRSSLVVLFAGLHAPLAADTVHLKSGFSIDGKVSEARSNQERLVLELNSTGTLTIPRSQVATVEKNARTGIPAERPAEEGRPTPLITPNTMKVKLKKGQLYYGQGELYGVKSPQSDDKVLILSIPGVGEMRVPQEAVERVEPASPVGAEQPAPAAAGARTIRTSHRIKLRNGEVLSGTLVPSRPEEPLVLDLGSLGRVYVPRDRIVEISAIPGEMKLPEPEEETPAPPAPQAEEARPPVEVPARTMMDPELKQEILDNVYDLTRWRTRNRASAERRLVGLGPVVIPFL